MPFLMPTLLSLTGGGGGGGGGGAELQATTKPCQPRKHVVSLISRQKRMMSRRTSAAARVMCNEKLFASLLFFDLVGILKGIDEKSCDSLLSRLLLAAVLYGPVAGSNNVERLVIISNYQSSCPIDWNRYFLIFCSNFVRV